MITGVWMNEDGGVQLAVELDDGEGGLVVVDFSHDPPSATNVDTLDGDGWDVLRP